MLEYRRTTDLSSTDLDKLNSELYALLAIKTADTAMASIKSLEEVEVQGIIGWQRSEREARGYHQHRVALLTETVTHQCLGCWAGVMVSAGQNWTVRKSWSESRWL